MDPDDRRRLHLKTSTTAAQIYGLSQQAILRDQGASPSDVMVREQVSVSGLMADAIAAGNQDVIHRTRWCSGS